MSAGFRGLQAWSRYKGVTGRYKAVTSRYGAVTNRYLAVTSRYGAGWLQRACALQRHSLRSQPSSDGLAPWVVPSAPLPQGDSLWLASSAICMRQAPKEERRAGRRLHGGTIVQMFVFYKGGVAGAPDSGVRPLMGTDGFVLACALLQRSGPAWRAPLSHRPTLQRF